MRNGQAYPFQVFVTGSSYSSSRFIEVRNKRSPCSDRRGVLVEVRQLAIAAKLG